jgi:hypothetical protein
VLRCSNRADTWIGGGHGPAMWQRPICYEHKGRIDEDERFSVRSDDSAVLMGSDLPPILDWWAANTNDGTEGVNFDLWPNDPAKKVSVFIPTEEAEMLADRIRAANNPRTE